MDSAPTTGSESRMHLPSVPLQALGQWLSASGQQRFRAAQIADWIYAKGIADFAQMTNLAKPLRTWLAQHAVVYHSQVSATQVAADGTRKLLLTWPDGQAVETVWIPQADRHTVCLSCQVGCPIGCRFCASGLGGLQRNLIAGEIVEQVLRVRQLLAASEPGRAGRRPPRLSNVVVMGMGEPLANYDAVLAAIRILNAPWGLNIGARKITLSTVGLPRQIRRLAHEGLQLNLALSLHAADQKLREQLIPRAAAPLAEILDACRYYFDRTGREVTLEYVLLDGVNTTPAQAAQLAKLAKGLRCNVNLLRYNPVPGLPFARPSRETASAFQNALRERGVNAHLRSSRGQDIEAACGQLRRRSLTSCDAWQERGTQ